jgi:alkylation response protein AidB-like acyl-CoA dehydrogenase
MIGQALSAAELIEAARRLGPTIRACRNEIEADRRLPTALLAAMHEARFFKMYVPAELGGLEIDPLTSMRVVEAIAEEDGAAAWALMIGSTYGIFAAFLAPDAAAEIFGAADAVVAGALRPAGIARAVEGGFVVSGRWSFASGIDHCAWWNGGCTIHDGDVPRRNAQGATETILAFFPAAQGGRIDTWETGGLRGTGSHDYAVTELFVPNSHAISLAAEPRARGLLYRMPQQALLDNAMAAIPLGIARGAIDTFVALASHKRPAASSSPTLLAERLTIQADVGRAEAQYHAARAFLYQSVEESWEAVQVGRALSVKELALLRLARTHATQAAVVAVDLMYTAGGGSSVYALNRLERAFRDIHTVTQHASMAPANYAVSGRILLGLPADRALYRL